MPQEYRLITLSNEELGIALASHRRVHPDFLPPGVMTVFLVTATGLEVTVAGADGATQRSSLDFAALAEPLITFCLDSNIKLPRAAEKRAEVSEGALALEMRLDSEAAAPRRSRPPVPRPRNRAASPAPARPPTPPRVSRPRAAA